MTTSLAMVSAIPTPPVSGTALREASISNKANARLSFTSGATLAIGRGRSSGCRDGCRRRWAGSGSRGRVTVPVGFGVIHALSNSDSGEAVAVNVVQHVVGQVQGCKLVDIMSDAKVLALIDTSLEIVLCGLDLLLSELVIVICIQVEGCYNISQGFEISLALSRARRVRWAHVSRVFADNVADSHLVLDHLIVTLLLSDCSEILVTPRVTGNLVTVVVHLLDNAAPVLINGTLADIVTGDEESGASAPGLKLCHDLLSIDVWTIVESEGNSALLQARSDTHTSVLDITELWTSIVTGACTSGSLIGIATRTVIDLAVRSLTVILRIAAIPLCIR